MGFSYVNVINDDLSMSKLRVTKIFIAHQIRIQRVVIFVFLEGMPFDFVSQNVAIAAMNFFQEFLQRSNLFFLTSHLALSKTPLLSRCHYPFLVCMQSMSFQSPGSVVNLGTYLSQPQNILNLFKLRWVWQENWFAHITAYHHHHNQPTIQTQLSSQGALDQKVRPFCQAQFQLASSVPIKFHWD